MPCLLQDSFFGKLCHIITNGCVFRYQEEINPELWRRYVNKKKSVHVARNDCTGSRDISDDELNESSYTESPPRVTNISSRSWEDGILSQGMTRDELDSEKGLNVLINPQNWSSGKKAFVTFQICLLTFGIYIGSSIYPAGQEDVMKGFRVSQVVVILGLSLFVAGYGIGPFIWSPMSEIPLIGRNPIYICTLVIFVALQVPTLMASNLGELLAFRFLTGFFGSPVLATGGASIADMYSPAKRAYAMGIWGISAVCGPVLGPLIGGFAAEANGWKWPIWELMWLLGFALLVLFFLLPETSAANILYRRTRCLKKVTGNESLRCDAGLDTQN
ncbi:GTPase-activating protein [Penicillium pulvis]|uniref:GTPase-activating protein n=1 Tax=Penicillium pulvis TaxID=1562058 RepID=UPI0025471F48|nr:GTPase-activating protein [Penicillium pulvis]KAJ5797264.1 GTPase-activating protein [Penicillium pulvis]